MRKAVDHIWAGAVFFVALVLLPGAGFVLRLLLAPLAFVARCAYMLYFVVGNAVVSKLPRTRR